MNFLSVRTKIFWLTTFSFFMSLHFELLSGGILISPLYWVICDQVRETDICTQVSSDPMNIHMHTNSCLLSFHCSWPSLCISVVLLWHIAGSRNPCSLPFFLCTSHDSNLSHVEVRELLMFFLCDCYLAELAAIPIYV